MYQSTPRSFFASLFDLSFRNFVTPSIISVIYMIALICIGLWALAFLWSGFQPSYGFLGTSEGPNFFSILMHLIGSGIIFVVGTIVARVQLEFAMAVFRIAENTTPKIDA